MSDEYARRESDGGDGDDGDGDGGDGNDAGDNGNDNDDDDKKGASRDVGFRGAASRYTYISVSLPLARVDAPQSLTSTRGEYATR